MCVQKLQLLTFKQSVFFSGLPPLPQSDTLRFTFPPALPPLKLWICMIVPTEAIRTDKDGVAK